MSYLVPGNKPKRCNRCPYLEPESLDCTLMETSFVYETLPRQHENCPLIELPPHGDLVDREQLLAEYDRQHKGPVGGARRIMEGAPVVIKGDIYVRISDK